MRALPAILVLICACAPALGQRKVDSRNSYERVIAIVPLTGAGTWNDPKRPLHAPPPVTPAQAQAAATTRAGILAYSWQLADDGKSAVVEFVAQDRKAFTALLADKNIKVFEKKKLSKQQLETEVKKHKKDFDATKLGTVLP